MPGATPSLDTIRATLVSALAPYAKRLFLFGSIATADFDEASDVDVLVELRPMGERPPLGLRWFALEQELAAELGRPVELVSDDAVSPHLRLYIDRQKVLLYAER